MRHVITQILSGAVSMILSQFLKKCAIFVDHLVTKMISSPVSCAPKAFIPSVYSYIQMILKICIKLVGNALIANHVNAVEKQLMKTCLCFVEFVIDLIIRFVSNLKYSTYLKIGNVSIALNANNVELMSTIMKKILIKALIYQIMIIN